jgi:hypothetical protein
LFKIGMIWAIFGIMPSTVSSRYIYTGMLNPACNALRFLWKVFSPDILNYIS